MRCAGSHPCDPQQPPWSGWWCVLTCSWASSNVTSAGGARISICFLLMFSIKRNNFPPDGCGWIINMDYLTLQTGKLNQIWSWERTKRFKYLANSEYKFRLNFSVDAGITGVGSGFEPAGSSSKLVTTTKLMVSYWVLLPSLFSARYSVFSLIILLLFWVEIVSAFSSAPWHLYSWEEEEGVLVGCLEDVN